MEQPLYDEAFISGLPPAEGWKAPLVACVARASGPPYRKMRALVEEYYRAVPAHEKNNVAQSLRSLDDEVFVAQLYEVYVWDFCGSLGDVEPKPTLAAGGIPDLAWTINGLRVVVEVVTSFGQRDIRKENEVVDGLLRYLGNMEHYFDVFIEYQKIDESALQPKAIRRALEEFLNRFDPNMTAEAELDVSLPGFEGTFIAIPRKDPSKIQRLAFGVMEPARWIASASSIRGRIREKIRKYGTSGLPLVVAVCRGPGADGADWGNVASELYGPVTYHPNLADRTLIPRLGPDGLVVPTARTGLRNRSLTGVLHCSPTRIGEKFGLQVLYLMNPFAHHRLPLPLPTYPVVEGGKIRFRWSSAPETDLGLH